MSSEESTGASGSNAPRRVNTTTCPNCKRKFNCAGPPNCWCLKVERTFDWEDFIIRTGMSSCVCPVCLTGKSDAKDA